jgi:hypothetical protein
LQPASVDYLVSLEDTASAPKAFEVLDPFHRGFLLEYLNVRPKPAFVIKTSEERNGRKVFINVLSHDCMKEYDNQSTTGAGLSHRRRGSLLETLGLSSKSSAQTASLEIGISNQTEIGAEQRSIDLDLMPPVMVVSRPRTTTDKSQNICTLIDIILCPDIIKRAAATASSSEDQNGAGLQTVDFALAIYFPYFKLYLFFSYSFVDISSLFYIFE